MLWNYIQLIGWARDIERNVLTVAFYLIGLCEWNSLYASGLKKRKERKDKEKGKKTNQIKEEKRKEDKRELTKI